MTRPCPVCRSGELIDYAPGEEGYASRMCAHRDPFGELVNGCGTVYLRLGDTWGRWLPEASPEAKAAPSVRYLVPAAADGGQHPAA